MFQMLRCDTIDDVGIVLSNDYNIICYSTEHFPYMIISFIAMFFYFLGIPLTLLFKLYRHRKYMYLNLNLIQKNVDGSNTNTNNTSSSSKTSDKIEDKMEVIKYRYVHETYGSFF